MYIKFTYIKKKRGGVGLKGSISSDIYIRSC